MSIFVKLYENKLYFKNTKTNNEYTIIPDKPFSQNDILIANIDEATKNIKLGIKKISSKINIYLIKPKIYLQPMKDINNITQVEHNGYMESFYKAGARALFIIKDENEVIKKLKIVDKNDNKNVWLFTLKYVLIMAIIAGIIILLGKIK
jgi:hypothetical protein